MGQVSLQLLVYHYLFQAFASVATEPIGHTLLETVGHRKHSLIVGPRLLCQMETAPSVWEDPCDPALVWVADIDPLVENYF